MRTLCLARETLAYHDALADFAFAMQGLGSGPITLFGDDELKDEYLPAVAAGEKIAAFALSEPEAGSDVAAMTTTATDGADHGHQDLDLQRRDRRLLHGLRARARGHHGVRRRRRRRRGRRADRRDGAAPARAARVPRRARAADRPARQGDADRAGDARRVPLDGRRRGAGLRAPRAGRGARPRPVARAVRRADGRAAAGAGQAGRDGARRRRQRAARLPRGVDEGRRRARA